jgi:hypothetical protein
VAQGVGPEFRPQYCEKKKKLQEGLYRLILKEQQGRWEQLVELMRKCEESVKSDQISSSVDSCYYLGST